MIKGVIFDVDGVLLNSMPVWENLGELYLDHLGIEAEKNLGETLFEMSLEEAADYLISHYNLEKTVEEVVQGLNKEVEDILCKTSSIERRGSSVSGGIQRAEDSYGDRNNR